VIRLEAAEFVPSKDQKRVLAKMERFLSDINNTPETYQRQRQGRHHDDERKQQEEGQEQLQGEEHQEKQSATEDSGSKEERPKSARPSWKATLADIVEKAVQLCIDEHELPAIKKKSQEAETEKGDEVEVVIREPATAKERKKQGDFSCNVAFKLQAMMEHSTSGSAEPTRRAAGESGGSAGKKRGQADKRRSELLLRAADIAKKLEPRVNQLLLAYERELSEGENHHHHHQEEEVEEEEEEEEEKGGGDIRKEEKEPTGHRWVRAVATGPWINFFLTEQSLLPSCSGANREEEQQTKQLRCEAGERASDDPRRPEPPVPHELKVPPPPLGTVRFTERAPIALHRLNSIRRFSRRSRTCYTKGTRASLCLSLHHHQIKQYHIEQLYEEGAR